MTMREDFREWWANLNGYPDPDDGYAFDAWQAAYRAGAEQMRERAAKVCDAAADFHMTHDVRAAIVDQNRAEDIRALPVDAA